MFCSNCGNQTDNNQRFCCHCGAENKNYMSESDAQTGIIQNTLHSMTSAQLNMIFNHNVLINYLSNLRSLEYAKRKLTNEERRITNQIDSLGHSHSVSNMAWEDSGPAFGGAGFFVVVFLIVLWINSGLTGEGFLSLFHDLLSPIVTVIMVLAAILALGCLIFGIYAYFDGNADYKKRVAEEEARLKREYAEKGYLVNILPLVKQDLKKTCDLLDSAYSLNIIPFKCRNIYGAHFLHEYISTSMVSLNDALYHFDLDEISRKLDVIIEQQQEIIMQQAHSNALNEQIVRQNEEILNHAIATEHNTALSAQYSQVAAVNSKTVATIQSYNFFKQGL